MGARRRRRGGEKRRLGVLLLLLLVALGAAYLYALRDEPLGPPPASPAPAGTMRVHYVDVGQGDATVWELPDGALVLYDCGPPASDAEDNPLVRYLRDTLGKPEGTRLAALIASHGHLDHVGGCEEVLATYGFDHLYEAWYEGNDAPESYRRFRDELLAEDATLHKLPELQPGTTLPLSSVRATLLWPRAFTPGGWDTIAEASLVVRLEHGSRAFCFQGDIESRQEAQLATELPAGGCDVTLVGHHGSRTASSAAWLARVEPQIAVASFGENGYGHPHPEALCRLQEAGADVYATHRAGTVVVETDGARLSVVRGTPETTDYCAPDASYWDAP